MLVRYNGPPDQFDPAVAAALTAARAGDVTTDLPDHRQQAQDGDTVEVTNPAEPASGILEPGRDYDLPGDLARHLIATSAHWSVSAEDFSKLSKSRLTDLAKERGIAGYTKMSQDELVAALRGEA